MNLTSYMIYRIFDYVSLIESNICKYISDKIVGFMYDIDNICILGIIWIKIDNLVAIL